MNAVCTDPARLTSEIFIGPWSAGSVTPGSGFPLFAQPLSAVSNFVRASARVMSPDTPMMAWSGT